MAAISTLSQAYGKREGSANVILLVKEWGKGGCCNLQEDEEECKGLLR